MANRPYKANKAYWANGVIGLILANKAYWANGANRPYKANKAN